LARIEIQSATAALARHLPELALAEEPERRPEFVIRGLRQLPLKSP
jgi:cytochrome P450